MFVLKFCTRLLLATNNLLNVSLLKHSTNTCSFTKVIHLAGKLALANASENLARRVENRPGRVEFCIPVGYIRDYTVQASAQNF